ncbi:uncharacterized protein TNCV_2629071 [Trichonephila clavipes]|uniref:Uncharacterized protein n=1 Tax=Trichonephila clavipes TaxID=2585209 RepID=A0A8X6SEZ0_TRICX|nr:uncharacterized protein TNCV_2629071 [Trichonephila clavipes]
MRSPLKLPPDVSELTDEDEGNENEVNSREITENDPPGSLVGSRWGLSCGSPVVKVSDHGRHVMSSSPVPLKIRRVGQRCTLNLSRAQTSSRWCDVVARRRGASSGLVHVTLAWFKFTRSVVKSSRVAEQCDVNMHSLQMGPTFA